MYDLSVNTRHQRVNNKFVKNNIYLSIYLFQHWTIYQFVFLVFLQLHQRYYQALHVLHKNRCSEHFAKSLENKRPVVRFTFSEPCNSTEVKSTRLFSGEFSKFCKHLLWRKPFGLLLKLNFFYHFFSPLRSLTMVELTILLGGLTFHIVLNKNLCTEKTYACCRWKWIISLHTVVINNYINYIK